MQALLVFTSAVGEVAMRAGEAPHMDEPTDKMLHVRNKYSTRSLSYAYTESALQYVDSIESAAVKESTDARRLKLCAKKTRLFDCQTSKSETNE